MIYFMFYFITTSVLLYLSPDSSKVIISLMNILLILAPLIGMLFGVINYYNSREFIELLLAQPVKRSSIFAGMLSGIILSLVASLLLGLTIPVLILGNLTGGDLSSFLILLTSGVFLTFIFTTLGFVISLFNENRLKGFGIAIIVWLFLAFVYDGLFLLSLIAFEAYPLEKLAIVMSLFNPIDLSRILIMLKLDISALLGYTGAVFNNFFGKGWGMFISLLALLFWSFIPLVIMIFKGSRKDF